MAPSLSCRGLCSSLRGKPIPLTWLMDLNRKAYRFFSMMGSLTATSMVIVGIIFQADIGYLVGLGCSAALGAAIAVFLTCGFRARVEMGLVTACSAAMFASVTFSAMLISEDFALRTRLQACCMILWKSLPPIFGFPFVHSIVLILVSVFIDCGVLHQSSRLFGDPASLRMYATSLAWGCCFAGFQWMSSNRLWKVFEAQEALAVERRLMDSIIAMMCDASAFISGDGRTILRADQRLNLMLGHNVVGRPLSDALADDEQQRVQDCLVAAKTSPVLLPTTLVTSKGLRIPVEMFIVGNRDAAKTDRRAGRSPAFLIGLRMSGGNGVEALADASASRQDLLQLAAARAAEGGGVPSAEHMSDPPSLPETSFTGRVFSAQDVELIEGDVDGVAMEQRLLNKVLALGREQRWLMDSKDIIVSTGKPLGQGSFGVVYQGWLHGTPVAVKSAKRPSEKPGLKQLLATANELRILRHVRHPNVVLFHGACVVPERGEVMLVLEHLQGPDLNRFVTGHSGEDQAFKRLQALLDVACALRYLHAQRPQVVHGDLKDTNVLVEPAVPRAKLIDFGLSRLLTRHAKPLGGTLDWMAPELFTTGQEPKPAPTTSTDVFSFGRLAYFVISCQRPLQGLRRNVILEMARRGLAPPLQWQLARPLQEECAFLCERLLDLDPKRRPDMADAHNEVYAWHVQNSMGMHRTSDAEHRPEGASPRAATGASRGSTTAVDDGANAQLALPMRQPTHEDVKQLTLLDVLMQWNFPVFHGACCRYHAATMELERVLRLLQGSSCKHAFSPHNGHQCKTCGILNIHRCQACEVCNQSASAPPSASAPRLLSISEEGEAEPEARAQPRGSLPQTCSL